MTVATLRYGSGSYLEDKRRVPFEIEISVEGDRFTGRIFNERSQYPETEITDGRIDGDRMTFIKKYPVIDAPKIEYDLRETGKGKFTGEWKYYAL